MKSAVEAAAKALSSESARTSAPPPMRPEPLDARLIDRLWLRMVEMFGHRWTTSFGDNPRAVAGQTWAMGLAGLTADQIAAGISACMASADPWPPTLPEFRAMCLQIPSMATVRADLARQNAERLPFTRLVWQKLDTWAFSRLDTERADRLLREAYADAREAVMRGHPMPEAPVELEAPKEAPKKASADVAARYIDEIKAYLVADDKAAA